MCVSFRPLTGAVFSAAVLLAATAHGAPPQGAPRAGDAEVRQGDSGVPCFTIAEKDERRFGAPYFQSIRVTDVTERQAAPMWLMEMPAGRSFPLMFSMCVPYAGRVAALPQRPADALAPGRLYEVLITVRAEDGASGAPASAAVSAHGALPADAIPVVYVARFCLLRKADGSQALRPLAPAARSAAACV
jgi:hypothetical protein